MDGSSSHPRSAMDSSSTLLLLDPQMADQLYVCLAEATGYGSYNRTELLQELLFGTQSGHNYAAYFTACAILFVSLTIAFFGVYFSRWTACVVGLYIGAAGALTLDGLFLPHSGDTKVDCISLEITSFGAAVFVGSMMLMFRKSIYVFAGIIFGEIAGGAIFNLLAADISGSTSHQTQTTLMGFCAVLGAGAMYAMGDQLWMVATAVVGSWYATCSIVEIFLLPKDEHYMEFLKYTPVWGLMMDHPRIVLTDVATNHFVRHPLLLFTMLTIAGILAQKALWARRRQRSVQGKGHGAEKRGYAQMPSGASSFNMM